MASRTILNNKLIFTSLLLALCIKSSLSKSVKSNSRPVHEIVNEQSRSDQDKVRPINVPYGNPLAGKSQQDARQHALHQQAMFNAERVRQHRAQLQRWTSAPQQMDSYMKAYHESQESHHLALERQQSKLKEANKENQGKDAKKFTPITATGSPQTTKKGSNQRPQVKRVKIEPPRTAKTENVRNKQDRNRSHRSYGSSDYYMHPTRYQTVYVNPGPNYEQGLTIKPNGNVGLSESNDQTQNTETPKLYTHAVPSKTQYVYPKQYNQMQSYQSAQDIATLSSLLQKKPHDQLSELNALIHSDKQNEEEHGSADASALHQPIDLYFYLKDAPSLQGLSEHYDQSKYAQMPHDYSQADHDSDIHKDHTPITEEVDDIADPNKPHKLTSYGVQSILTSQEQTPPETTTVKSNNYYKVEVASQTISAGYNRPSYHSHAKQPIEYVLQQEVGDDHESKPTYQTAHYGKQPLYYYKDEKDSSDSSERYLHHNAQYTGVQHLTEDGTGVSAYGEQSENLHYAANYEFGYRVRDHESGNDFGHSEAKSGGKTSGHYHVLLPDGRRQKVDYWAGPSGFHADISYDHLSERSGDHAAV